MFFHQLKSNDVTQLGSFKSIQIGISKIAVFLKEKQKLQKRAGKQRLCIRSRCQLKSQPKLPGLGPSEPKLHILHRHVFLGTLLRSPVSSFPLLYCKILISQLFGLKTPGLPVLLSNFSLEVFLLILPQILSCSNPQLLPAQRPLLFLFPALALLIPVWECLSIFIPLLQTTHTRVQQIPAALPLLVLLFSVYTDSAASHTLSLNGVKKQRS